MACREVQLGLAGDVGLPDGVIAEPFLDDEVVGIAAPAAIRLRRGRADVGELAKHTQLVREAGSSTRAVAKRALARVAAAWVRFHRRGSGLPRSVTFRLRPPLRNS